MQCFLKASQNWAKKSLSKDFLDLPCPYLQVRQTNLFITTFRTLDLTYVGSP